MKKIFFYISTAIFFAGCSLGTGGNDGGIFRSDNGGKNFSQKVNIDQKSNISGVDVLSMATNSQNGSEAYVGTKSSGIFKTDNGGENWRQLKIALLTPSKTYSMAVNPNNTKEVYAATLVGKRGKILKSEDGGENWMDVYTQSSSNTFVLSLTIDPKNSEKVYAGTSEGLILFSENGGESWRNIFVAGAEVYQISIDNFNPDVVYFVVYNKTVLRTQDGGKTFEDLAQKQEFSFEQRNQFQEVTSIAADPSEPNLVYLGSDGGLFRSKNRGDDWEVLKILIKPREQAVRGIGINPQNSDEIVFGANQAFYKSIDGGASWSTVQLEGTRSIESIQYDRQNPAIIYVGMNKR